MNSPSARVHSHIRSNLVGYIAIFMFAIGGTAYATHPGGANTVGSGDIINDEVKTQDIAAGHVTSQDIGTGEVRARTSATARWRSTTSPPTASARARSSMGGS